MRHRSVSVGFSFWELLILLIILCVGLLLSIPALHSMRAYLIRQQAYTQLWQLLTFVELRALSHSLVICPSASGRACDGAWQEGQLVFVGDSNEVENEAAILRYFPALQGELTWRGFLSNDFLLWTPDFSTQAVNGHFTYCYQGKGFRLFVNRIGNMREEEMTC